MRHAFASLPLLLFTTWAAHTFAQLHHFDADSWVSSGPWGDTWRGGLRRSARKLLTRDLNEKELFAYWNSLVCPKNTTAHFIASYLG
jgi:hypothetical protein